MIQILYSAQSKLVQAAAKKLYKEKFPNPKDINFVVLDMNRCSLLDLYGECASLPLGYDSKCVVADYVPFLAKGKTKFKIPKSDDEKPLLSYFENPDPAIDLFLLVHSDALDTSAKTNPFYEALTKGGAKFSPVAAFTEQQWSDYIPKFFAKRHIDIDSMATAELIRRVGGDYTRFLSEAQKLVAYSGGERITKDIVEMLVAAPLEENMYAISNALLRGDNRAALLIYDDFKVHNPDPVFLINLLGRQFMGVDQVASLLNQNYPLADIARTMGWSSGRVSATVHTIQRAGRTADFGRMVDDLYHLEKNIFTGRVDPELAFTLYLANFSL